MMFPSKDRELNEALSSSDMQDTRVVPARREGNPKKNLKMKSDREALRRKKWQLVFGKSNFCVKTKLLIFCCVFKSLHTGHCEWSCGAQDTVAAICKQHSRVHRAVAYFLRFSKCPPLSSSPNSHSFVLGTAVINNNPTRLGVVRHSQCQR